MRAWDHGLRVTTGRGLEAFACQDLLSSPVGTDGLVHWPADSGISRTSAPPVLCVVSDQASTNLCALNFMRQKLVLNVEHFGDPHHRAWNDVLNAVGKAGLRTAVIVAQTIHNIAYGPFQNSAFFSDLSEAAVDVSKSMSPNDPLLLFLWKGICEDMGIPELHRGQEERTLLGKFADLQSRTSERPQEQPETMVCMVA